MPRRKFYITSGDLRRHNACIGQRRRFRKFFPKGRVEITLKTAERYALQFNWGWAAKNLLADHNRTAWETLSNQMEVLERSKAITKRALRLVQATHFAAHLIAQGIVR